MNIHRVRLLASASVALATIALAPPAAADPVDSAYVALGDSFSAGSGIAPNEGGGCGRSLVNYPSLVAEELGVDTFRDVTCGAATSADFLAPQSTVGGNPASPQYDALTPGTTLVTVGIGGNDVELVQLALSCINLLPEPYGRSCAAGDDVAGKRIAAFAPGYGTVIDEIKSRSPLATVALVGYPTGVRAGGCPGEQPIWPADATYLQSKIEQLNDAMAAEATEHGALFVDLTESTRGHDACAGNDAWMVGLVPTSLDAVVPLHPNAAGHANAARQVVDALE